MNKIAEQPLMDYMLAMQAYLQRGNVKMAQQYSDLIQELLVKHAESIEIEAVVA